MTPYTDTTDTFKDEDDISTEQLQDLLSEYTRFIVESSPFASENWTENNGLPIEW